MNHNKNCIYFFRFSQSGNLNRHMRVHGTNQNNGGNNGNGGSNLLTWQKARSGAAFQHYYPPYSHGAHNLPHGPHAHTHSHAHNHPHMHIPSSNYDYSSYGINDYTSPGSQNYSGYYFCALNKPKMERFY